ncbi:MAG: hypothetical protein R6W78_01235, partial [Bacteroidales bacterium]
MAFIFSFTLFIQGQSAGTIQFTGGLTKWIAFPGQKVGAFNLNAGHHNGNCSNNYALQAYRYCIDNAAFQFVENANYKLAPLGCLIMDDTHLTLCGYPMLNIIEDWVGKDVKLIRSQQLGVSDGLWGCKRNPLVYNTPNLNVIVLPKITPESQDITYGQSLLATTIQLPGINNNTTYEYQWQYSFDYNSWFNFGNITQSFVNTVINTTNNYKVRCAVKLKETGQVTHSNVVSVNVTIPALNPGSISGTQSLCYNTSSSLYFTSVPGGGIKTYGYQWQISTNKELWNDISGAVNSSYNTGNLTQTRYYRCRVTSGAQTGYTNELTITV